VNKGKFQAELIRSFLYGGSQRPISVLKGDGFKARVLYERQYLYRVYVPQTVYVDSESSLNLAHDPILSYICEIFLIRW
jgi:hypothetical protein